MRRPTRRAVLTGGGVLALTAGGGIATHLLAPADGQGAATARLRPADPPLRAAYATLRDDLLGLWWNAEGSDTSDGLPGIRATDGSGGINTGRPITAGSRAPIAAARGAAFWQDAQFLFFLANDRALRTAGGALAGEDATAAMGRVRSQRTLWRTIYTQAELAGAGDRDGTINVSDDAAWKLMALRRLHEASGRPEDFAALAAALRAVCDHYRDTYTPAHQVGMGVLTVSRYGMLYARPEQDPNGQGRSTLFECGTLDAALYLHRHTGAPEYLLYPATVYASFRERLQQPNGIYFLTLQLDPEGRHDSTPFLTPIDASKPIPRQDFTGSTIMGTMGMAVVAAGLFAATGDDRYRADIAHIAAGIASHYLQNGCIICDRDGWTPGAYAYDFATRCLSLPGVDPDGRVARALVATGERIVATRTPIAPAPGLSGHGYSSEWSGNTERSIGESATGRGDGHAVRWAENAAQANGGRGGGVAAPDQIMTNASSGMMVQAALHLAMQGGAA